MLLGCPGSLWSDDVISFRCGRLDTQLSQFNGLICLGKRQTEEQMKWDCEDEGICWLSVCVNGTLDFPFPISALMICLRLLPWRSALLPYPSLITWERHAPQVHLMAPLFPRFLLKCIILIAYSHLWPMLKGQVNNTLIVVHHVIKHNFVSFQPSWGSNFYVECFVFIVLNRKKRKEMRLCWSEYYYLNELKGS